MMKHRFEISLVVAAIGIPVILFWIATAIPTATERDAAQKDLDISGYMTGIIKIRYVVVDIDTGRHIERLQKSPSDMEIVSLETALQNAMWEYKQGVKGSQLDLAVEEYFELIYEEGEDRRFVMVLDEYWIAMDRSQENHIVVIKGPSLKEFLSIIRSRAKPERSD